MNDARGMLRIADHTMFGAGSIRAAATVVGEFGSRVLIVTDAFLRTTEGFASLVASLHEHKLDTLVVSDVSAEVPVDEVAAVVEAARGFDPQVVLGYGGGSALDAAKLVALLLAHPGPLASYYGENRVPGPVLPLVAVPTTAGTGSEVTPVAVLLDRELRSKVGISSPHLVPRRAIVDPELSHGAPRSVSVYAGADAFVHAVESYTARPLPAPWDEPARVFTGRNVLAEPLALHAAGVISRSLPIVAERPDDTAARSEMAYGSLLAGIAFGSTGTHLSHAIQYPLGSETHTPHGMGTGMLLPFVLEVCVPVAADRIADIGVAMGVRGLDELHSDVARAHRTIEAIVLMNGRIGLPASLEEMGVERSRLPALAEATLDSARLVAIAPVDVDAEMILRILSAAYEGDHTLLRYAATGSSPLG